MGCAGSVTEEEKKSRELDKKLKEDAKKAALDIKLLLLGAGECGKSTILKQMKIINMDGFTKDDFDQYKGIIYSNTIQSLGSVLKAIDLLKISYGDPARKADANRGLIILIHLFLIWPFISPASNYMEVRELNNKSG